MFLPLRCGVQPVEAEPTPLLTLVAGEFAPQVARLCAPPHADFLTASAARRHLVYLALAFGREEVCATVLHARMGRALRHALDGPPPAGLARALTRMGETAWSVADYRSLIELLGRPDAAKVLWHLDQVTPEMIGGMARLPKPISGALQLAGALGPGGAEVVQEAYDAIRFRAGVEAADQAARRWARASTVDGLFEAVRDELYPEPAAPPHPGTPLLRPLATKAAFRDAARRYSNCLAAQLPYAGSGWSAYYEWLGEPGAVIEITRDHMVGWRLEQARLAGNAPVPLELQSALARELGRMRVFVGRSGWELDRAVTSQGRGDVEIRPLCEALGEVFGYG